MMVLFINYNHLDTNNGIHVFNLANHLTRLGVECAVCIPDKNDATKKIGTTLFEVIDFDKARRNDQNRKVDIIHAWTPREAIRLMTEELAGIHKCPYVVHLEDNEESILEATFGRSFAKLSRLSRQRLDRIIPPHLSHPMRYKEFLDKACGISVIMDTLQEFCPPDLPSEVIWPGYDDNIDWAPPFDTGLRQRLGIGTDEYVVVYTGNVHFANQLEVSSLYLAIGLLNRRGIRTRIVRTGSDHVQLLDRSLEKVLKEFCINLGHVDRSELPAILSLANVLVQPGKADQFNNYRFPSKLPEYLATGKPVLLPATNIGRYLKDGDECILLQQGHALEIAQKLETLFHDNKLRKKIGAAGRHFAEQNLQWSQSAAKLQAFYQRLLDSPGRVPSVWSQSNITDVEETMPSQKRIVTGAGNLRTVVSNVMQKLNLNPKDTALIQRYRGMSLPILSYATVKDYCDSADHLSHVMRFDGDLKDLQRPWMIKSILGTVPPGAKLLEIGGGEPLVANALQKLGYDVTLVDPYDGSGNGPQAYAQYSRDYPHIKIIKSYFGKDTPSLFENTFDCIFSISVLEHVPHPNLPDVFYGLSRFLKPGGCSIHCTDLVLAGHRADWHDQGVREMLFWQIKLQNPDLDEDQTRRQVDEMFEEYYQKMAGDLETYYHSAQGHNVWRGKMPYEEFPFRKIVSMQTCATKT